jgi:CRISPR-associated protein (TIGR02584 family)
MPDVKQPKSRAGKPRRTAHAASLAQRHTVLVAVTGLSPAVLTETVWALAHESPPVIPNQIVALTTEPGRAAIAEQLFGPDAVWQQLRAALLGPEHDRDSRLDFDCVPDRVKVFHRRNGSRRVPLAEVASLADNRAIADALVDELWLQTSKPDTRLIASLAGGYKTMSALCLSAMQLLASPGDRVTHVLVGRGFDQARPRFFFPGQETQELDGPAGPLRARDAAGCLQLIDVPVIPLRRWFEELLQTKPPSYEVLLTQGADALQSLPVADLRIELGPVVLGPGTRPRHFIRIDGEQIALTRDRYAYLRFFAEQLVGGTPAFERPADAIECMDEWLRDVREREPRFFQMSEAFERGFTVDNLARRLSDLRTFLARSSPAGRRLATALPGKGRWTLQLPPGSVTLHA